MRKEIAWISPFRTGVIYAAVLTVLYLTLILFSLIFGGMTGGFGGPMEGGGGMMLGTGVFRMALGLVPAVIGGFVAGLLGAIVYNIAAGITGGVVIELRDG